MWPVNHVLRGSRDKWKSYISTSMRSMATKFDRNVAPDKRMLSIKLRNPLITWTHKSGHLTNKKCYICISTRSVVPNLTVWSQNYKIKCSFNHVVLWGHVTNKKLYISSSGGPMTTKLRRIITYDKGSQPNIDMTQESLDKTCPCWLPTSAWS